MKRTLILLLIIIGAKLNAQIPNNISKSDKIYGLSKFWQEVNYNFVYLNKIDRDKWEEDYKDLITKVQETENDYEYYRLLQKFCATLNDGHTNVYLPNNIKLFFSDFGEYRFLLSNIEGKAIVTNVSLSKKDEIPIGSEIIKVNGLETKKYLDNYVLPYISSSTDYIRLDKAIKLMFNAPEGTSFDVVLRLPNKEIKNLKLTNSYSTERKMFPEFKNQQLMEFKWMDKEIAYVSLNSFSNTEINDLFEEKLPELYKAKKIIIDLRENGGGSTNIGQNIIQYLTKDKKLYGSKTCSRLHIPAFKAWGSFTKAEDTVTDQWYKQAYLSYRDNYFHYFPYNPDKIKLKAKRIEVPTALLIGHNTASAAEDFLIFADNQEHMVKIGEPTFGSTGQPLLLDLPGGGRARICTKKDTYPDGREFVGYGIQPDIEITKTLEDYLEGKDPVLEAAIEYLNKH